MKPKRIQRKRTSGYKMPAGAIYVGRPTKWGNPYMMGPRLKRAQAVALYEKALEEGRLPFTKEDVRRELGGCDLACWCPPATKCHADVLLRIANAEEAA